MSDKKNDGYSCQFSEDVFFEQYKIYVEEIIEKYLPADECQYEEFADMIADSLQKKKSIAAKNDNIYKKNRLFLRFAT